MTDVVHYRGKKSIKVPMSNITKLMDLFEEHGLTEAFSKSVSRAKLSVDPMIAMMIDRNIVTNNLVAGNLSVGRAFEAIATINGSNLDPVLKSSLDDTYVEMTPSLVNAFKTFIGHHQLYKTNAFAATAIGQCVSPVPYHCPKWF